MKTIRRIKKNCKTDSTILLSYIHHIPKNINLWKCQPWHPLYYPNNIIIINTKLFFSHIITYYFQIGLILYNDKTMDNKLYNLHFYYTILYLAVI